MNDAHNPPDPDGLEERLRLTFRAVAERPAHEAIPAATPAAAPAPAPALRVAGRPGARPGRGHRRFLIAVASIAALALVIALALTFGPHNSTASRTVPKGPAATSHQNPPASLLPVTHPLGHTTPTTPTTPTPLTTPTVTPLTTPPVTEQLTYQPFEGSQLDPSLHVAAQGSGACFTYGGGADGRYLYRCGTIQPCFAGSDGTSAPLACPLDANPTTNDVTLWTATSVDTTGFVPATTKTPWAMQLSDGEVCALVNAAWSGLGPFGCTSSAGTSSAGNSSTGTGATGAATGPADCRQPLSSTTLWTAECQDQLTQASPFGVQPVAKIWF
jgi:hypothetical protein